MLAFRNLSTLAGLFLLIAGLAPAAGGVELLPPEQAFRVEAQAVAGNTVRLGWQIAPGYYLYRDKFRFNSKTPEIALGEPRFPPGISKHDEFFGEVTIYRDQVTVELPLRVSAATPSILRLEVTHQGCADIGVCYPPHQQTLQIDLSTPPTASTNSFIDSLSRNLQGLGINLFKPELLPPDEAFRFFAEVKDASTLRVNWQIADDYYLYREKFAFRLPDSPAISLADYSLPHGEPKHDEEFGQVEVFYHAVSFDLPLQRNNVHPMAMRLEAKFQGCAERGVCYPPISKTVSLQLPAAPTSEPVAAQTPRPPTVPISEQDSIAGALKDKAFWFTGLSFFGFGLLLAFTPCVFPMIPILSGIIVGHGSRLTTRHAFLLSSAYVLASAITYTVFGILAGLFGANLQALFQHPAILIGFSLLFVLLALSMFGFYTLQLPTALQSRLSRLGSRGGGTVAGAAIMGVLSALIVGPCVAAPLAGALIYIGQTGDAVLGGFALFAMGLGMGLPLIILGTWAGKLLPKAGPWMNTIKSVFGVILLAVAIWLLERILPGPVTMVAWAILLIVPAVYLGATDSLPAGASGWRKLWKGLGILLLAYGLALLLGAAAGNHDPLQPLAGIVRSDNHPDRRRLEFQRVQSLPALEQRLRQAAAAGRYTMLDFYADWCISCKEMERDTFSDRKVQAALTDVVLLQADVTANNAADQQLLRRFNLIGPPAILFFGPERQELKPYRVIGYQDTDQFLSHLRQVLQ